MRELRRAEAPGEAMAPGAVRCKMPQEHQLWAKGNVEAFLSFFQSYSGHNPFEVCFDTCSVCSLIFPWLSGVVHRVVLCAGGRTWAGRYSTDAAAASIATSLSTVSGLQSLRREVVQFIAPAAACHSPTVLQRPSIFLGFQYCMYLYNIQWQQMTLLPTRRSWMSWSRHGMGSVVCWGSGPVRKVEK